MDCSDAKAIPFALNDTFHISLDLILESLRHLRFFSQSLSTAGLGIIFSTFALVSFILAESCHGL